MGIQETSCLCDPERSREFYDHRYEEGYLDEWPPEKKRRIREVVQSLGLPKTGDALDFGCGNGVLTDILRQALPGWRVCGTDISKTAIDNAGARYPGCTFFKMDDPHLSRRKFDFIFTNHVFEHVFDLDRVFDQMAACLKPESSMLHFLPCGNEGSYEHRICLLRKDGINKALGNRFFFEDQGHVRRLTTEEFCELCRAKGFELKTEVYRNQYDGAIEWITNSHPRFVWMLTAPSRAVNRAAGRKLKRLRRRLILITMLRLPAQLVHKISGQKNRSFRSRVLLIIGRLFYVFSAPLDRYWKKRAQREWETRRFDRRGSEMGLCFKRG